MLEKNPRIGTTKAIFITFEPITFPITISFLFLVIADMVAANSGKLVPIAMIVNPIINWGTFNNIAIDSACMTAKWDPPIKAIKPIARNKLVLLIGESGSSIKGLVSSCDLNLYVIKIN